MGVSRRLLPVSRFATGSPGVPSRVITPRSLRRLASGNSCWRRPPATGGARGVRRGVSAGDRRRRPQVPRRLRRSALRAVAGGRRRLAAGDQALRSNRRNAVLGLCLLVGPPGDATARLGAGPADRALGPRATRAGAHSRGPPSARPGARTRALDRRAGGRLGAEPRAGRTHACGGARRGCSASRSAWRTGTP